MEGNDNVGVFRLGSGLKPTTTMNLVLL